MFSDFREKSKNWMVGPFIELDVDTVNNRVDTWLATSNKLGKSLKKESPSAADVAVSWKEECMEFRKNVPLIQALASKALKRRHWKDISMSCSVEIIYDEELTLKQLIDMDIMQHWEEIEGICTLAEKEHSLYKMFVGLQDEWSDQMLELKDFKGSFILKGIDDIFTLLDDQIVKLQTMMGSPFVRPFKPECREFMKKLVYFQELLEEWLKVQRLWMYLEPIFASEDIMRQMPQEGRRFKDVDTVFRRVMGEVNENPHALTVASNEKRKGLFEAANKKLDLIQKGLNDYLEIKRLAFSRFFFLSNDQLLEILASTKDPRAVQPFLGTCFEGIKRVGFNQDELDDNIAITQIIDPKGEVLELNVPVYPNKGAAKGNVEVWMTSLLSSMRISVKSTFMKAMEQYVTIPRSEWILNWQGQIILNCGSLYWTKDCTDHLQDPKKKIDVRCCICRCTLLLCLCLP